MVKNVMRSRVKNRKGTQNDKQVVSVRKEVMMKLKVKENKIELKKQTQ